MIKVIVFMIVFDIKLVLIVNNSVKLNVGLHYGVNGDQKASFLPNDVNRKKMIY